MLKNRAVLGEFQPCEMIEGKRVSEGDPIKGYFPRIIENELFYRVAQGVLQRLQRGRVGKDPISISGIACCAYRKSPMRYDNKGAAGAPISFAVGRNADDAALHTGEKSWFWTSIRAKRLRFLSVLRQRTICPQLTVELSQCFYVPTA